MALDFILNLFSTLPGTVVYHIVVFLGLLGPLASSSPNGAKCRALNSNLISSPWSGP